MRRTPVSSSNIDSVGYDKSTEVLEVEFSSGSVYQYFGVPQGIYKSFMSAGSHGTYLNDHIKDHYRYQRVS